MIRALLRWLKYPLAVTRDYSSTSPYAGRRCGTCASFQRDTMGGVCARDFWATTEAGYCGHWLPKEWAQEKVIPK